MKIIIIIIACLALALAACSAKPAPKPAEIANMMGDADDETLTTTPPKED